MTQFRDGLLYVRDLDIDGLPVLPADWEVWPEDAGWYSVRTDLGEILATWRANTDLAGTQALYLLLGPRATLDTLAGGAPLRVVWQAALSGSGTARAVMRRWPTFRCSGFERDSEGNTVAFTGVRRLLPTEGLSLPNPGIDPFPWLLREDGTITTLQVEAKYRIDSITRPALTTTMAGWMDHLDAEDTDV